MAFFSSKISSTSKKLDNIIEDKKKMQDILKQCTCQVNVAILIFKCKSKLPTQTAIMLQLPQEVENECCCMYFFV